MKSDKSVFLKVHLNTVTLKKAVLTTAMTRRWIMITGYTLRRNTANTTKIFWFAFRLALEWMLRVKNMTARLE